MRTPAGLSSLLPLSLFSVACVSEHGPLTNRMAQSATPYLARAAREPVSWQPWGRDAFALAARLDRPILLYVGADDCRWCGVMDREVYGDPALGALIDSLFVPVRVDRDERPDIADRYETAVRLLAGLRGYPITVFLTPDGSAFFGGTYFPLDDPVTGRGMKQVLPEVAKSYREHRASLVQRAALVRQLSLGGGRRGEGGGALPHGVLRLAAVRHEVDQVRAALEAASGGAGGAAAHGGFSAAQAAGLMLATYAHTGDSSYLAPARAVLDVLIDSAVVPLAETTRDDPPEVVGAAVLRDLTAAWAATGDPRYRDAARDVMRRLAGRAGRADRPVFADREAYVLGALLDAAAAVGVGDSAAEGAGMRARAQLDSLLKRTYAAGHGVRHVASRGGASPARLLLQDQVQVAGACLAAYDAGGARYLAVARDLMAVVERDFADSGGGGFFDVAAMDPAAPALQDRGKPFLDELLPGANAWLARVLLKLGDVTGDARYRRRAEATLEAFAGAAADDALRASTYLAVAQDAFAAR